MRGEIEPQIAADQRDRDFPRKIGVIGGMGPETTAAFYLRMVELCRASGWTTRPAVLVWSVPVPLELESRALAGSGSVDPYLPLLEEAARGLERAGADFLVMPCNSMHVFSDRIRQVVGIPLHGIVEAALDRMAQLGCRSARLLATSITASSGIYTRAAAGREGVNLSLPTPEGQEALNHLVGRIVSGEKEPWMEEVLRAQIESATDCDCVLLACTDLQIVSPKRSDRTILDTMDILARRAVELAAS